MGVADWRCGRAEDEDEDEDEVGELSLGWGNSTLARLLKKFIQPTVG